MEIVASFTDAWIETYKLSHPVHKHWSHLLQMRGLKPTILQSKLQQMSVASFTDAWIETFLLFDGWVAVSRIFYRCVD